MRLLFPVTASKKINYEKHPIRAARTAALCWVFSIVQRKGMPPDGTVCRVFPMGGAGSLPGEPERNAVSRKGDTVHGLCQKAAVKALGNQKHPQDRAGRTAHF